MMALRLNIQTGPMKLKRLMVSAVLSFQPMGHGPMQTATVNQAELFAKLLKVCNDDLVWSREDKLSGPFQIF